MQQDLILPREAYASKSVGGGSVAASEWKARKGSFSFESGKMASESKHDSPRARLPFSCDAGADPNAFASEDTNAPEKPPSFKIVCAK